MQLYNFDHSKNCNPCLGILTSMEDSESNSSLESRPSPSLSPPPALLEDPPPSLLESGTPALLEDLPPWFGLDTRILLGRGGACKCKLLWPEGGGTWAGSECAAHLCWESWRSRPRPIESWGAGKGQGVVHGQRGTEAQGDKRNKIKETQIKCRVTMSHITKY